MNESVKIIEVKSEIIDKMNVGAFKSGDKRYHLFVKIYRGNGLQKAAGVEFDNEDDAKMAQKLVHGVVNEVLA